LWYSHISPVYHFIYRIFWSFSVCCRLQDNEHLAYASTALKTALARTTTQVDAQVSEQEAAGAVGRYHVGVVKVLGENSSAIKVNHLTTPALKMVRTEYKTFILPFASLMQKWQPFQRTPLEDWIAPNSCKLTHEQLQMKTMTSRVLDITRATNDGILFRTVANQEKFLIDNACVIYPYNKKVNNVSLLD
jgi:hypothetical protein